MNALKPAVVVMDISLPDVSGIEAARRMLAREPALRILMFSMHEEAIFASRALQAGAAGYVTKASAPEILVEEIIDAFAERYAVSVETLSAAEEGVSLTEDNEIRQIVSELHLDHPDFIQVRSRWVDQLSVMKNLPTAPKPSE